MPKPENSYFNLSSQYDDIIPKSDTEFIEKFSGKTTPQEIKTTPPPSTTTEIEDGLPKQDVIFPSMYTGIQKQEEQKLPTTQLSDEDIMRQRKLEQLEQQAQKSAFEQHRENLNALDKPKTEQLPSDYIPQWQSMYNENQMLADKQKYASEADKRKAEQQRFVEGFRKYGDDFIKQEQLKKQAEEEVAVKNLQQKLTPEIDAKITTYDKLQPSWTDAYTGKFVHMPAKNEQEQLEFDVKRGVYENDMINYRIAKNILTDAKNTLNAPTKLQGGGFWYGAGQEAKQLDTWVTIVGLADNIQKSRIVELGEANKPLLKSEESVLDAIFDYYYIANERAGNISKSYLGGQMAGKSIPFMIDFVMTGGFAAGATKGLSKVMARHIEKKLIQELGEEGYKKLTKFGVDRLIKAPTNLAGELVTGAIQAPMTPTFYSGVLEETMSKPVEKKEDGGYVYMQGAPVKDAIVRGMNEVIFERSGGFIGDVFNPIGKVLKNTNYFTKVASTKIGKFSNLFYDGSGKFSKAIKATGFNGIASEIGEEVLGQTANYLEGVSTKEEMNEFFSKDNFQIMLMGFLPMTGISAAGNVMSNVKVSYDHKKSIKNINDIFGEQAQNIITSIDEATPMQLNAIVDDVLLNNNGYVGNKITDEGKMMVGAIIGYAGSKAKVEAMKGIEQDTFKELASPKEVLITEENGKHKVSLLDKNGETYVEKSFEDLEAAEKYKGTLEQMYLTPNNEADNTINKQLHEVSKQRLNALSVLKSNQKNANGEDVVISATVNGISDDVLGVQNGTQVFVKSNNGKQSIVTYIDNNEIKKAVIPNEFLTAREEMLLSDAFMQDMAIASETIHKTAAQGTQMIMEQLASEENETVVDYSTKKAGHKIQYNGQEATIISVDTDNDNNKYADIELEDGTVVKAVPLRSVKNPKKASFTIGKKKVEFTKSTETGNLQSDIYSKDEAERVKSSISVTPDHIVEVKELPNPANKIEKGYRVVVRKKTEAELQSEKDKNAVLNQLITDIQQHGLFIRVDNEIKRIDGKFINVQGLTEDGELQFVMDDISYIFPIENQSDLRAEYEKQTAIEQPIVEEQVSEVKEEKVETKEPTTYSEIFEITKTKYGVDVALQDMQDEVILKTEELTKAQEKLKKSGAGERIKLREQIATIEQELNDVNQIIAQEKQAEEQVSVIDEKIEEVKESALTSEAIAEQEPEITEEVKETEAEPIEETQQKEVDNQSNISIWIDDFNKAKESKDLNAIQTLYDKIKIAKNGVIQGKIKDPKLLEATINELSDLQKEIEEYAEELKNGKETPQSTESVKPTQKPKATTKPKQQPAKPTTASIPNTINTSVEKLPIKFKHKSLSIVNEAIAVQNGVLRATDLEVFIETPTDKADGVYNVLGSNKLFESEKNVDEFPIVPRVQGEFMDLPIAVSDISSRVNEVSKDEWRPIMGCVHLQSSDGKLSIMTTDGHTLRVKIVDTNLPDFAINISHATLKALKKLKGDAKVRIKFDDKYIVFDLGNGTQITSRLLEGNYPNISGVMPKITEYKEIKIKGDLNSIIEGVQNYYNNNKREDGIYVRSEQIVLNIDGFKIGVSIAHLSKYKNATLYVGTSPTKAILFKDNTNNTFGIIMPVMIQLEEESDGDLDKNIVADAEFVEGEVEIPEYNNIPAQTNSQFNAIQEATADTKLSQLSIQERVTAVQNAVEQINDGRVVEYVDDMHTYLIETYANEPDTLERIESLHKSGGKVGGITRGDIIIINTNRATIQGCLSTFEHERQHLEVKNNPLWKAIKQDIIQNTDRQILDDAVAKLSNTLFYRELGIDDLADEYIAHVIQNVFDNKKINTNLKYQNIIEDEYRRQNGNRLARIDGWSTRTDNVTAGSGGQLTIDYGAAEGGLLGSTEVGAEIDELGQQQSIPTSDIGFYSTVEKALSNIKQDKGTREQFKAMLLKNGAKQAEMDWMGFDELPEKLTKTDIKNWIDENRIEVEEVEKGAYSNRDLELVKVEPFVYNVVDTKTGKVVLSNVSQSRADDFIDNAHDGTDTKFAKYTLPGGENYKEVLLTMPDLQRKNRLDYNGRFVELEKEVLQRLGDNIKYPAAFNLYDAKHDGLLTPDELSRLNSIDQQANKKLPENFKSSHFDEPNILAHIRFNERTDSEGNKVLFIEEIQSDWAQTGKKKGYGTPKYTIKDVTISENGLSKVGNDNNSQNYFIRQIRNDFVVESTIGIDVAEFDNIEKAKIFVVEKENERQEQLQHGVPDMPFKKTDQWVNLAIRRMMRYAAENGFDRIAWTNGEQQAERYDLSEQVSLMSLSKNKTGTYNLVIEDLQGQELPEYKGGGKAVTASELEDIVGKDYAKNLIEGADRNYGKEWGKNMSVNPEFYTLRTKDFKVGGSGMKGFYDTIVPSAMSKLGKPFGAKVEEIGINTEKQNVTDEYVIKNARKVESIEQAEEILISGKNEWIYNINGSNVYRLYDYNDIQDAIKSNGVFKVPINLTTVQSLPVTESMKESVMEGMPLFQAIAPESTDNATIVGELSTDVNPDNAKQASRVRESYVDKYLEIKKRLSDKNTNMVDAYQGVLQFIEALAKDKTWAKWDKTALPQLRSIRDSVRELKKAGAHYSILKKLDMAMELVLQRQYDAAEKIIKNFAKLKVEGTTAKGVKIQKKIDVTAATFFKTLGIALPNGQDVNIIESRIQNLQLELDAATDQSIKDNLEAQIKALTLVKQHKISQSAYNINIGLLVDDINKITQEYNLRDKRREIMRAYGKISSNNKKIDDPETTNKEELRKQNDDIRANIEILKGEYKQLKGSVKHDKQSKKDVQLFKNMLLNERLSQQKEMEWFIKELDTILSDGVKAKRTFVAKEKEHKDKINSEALRAIGYNSDKSFINPAKSESKKTAWSKIIHSIDSFSSMLKLLDVSAADGRGLLYTRFFTDGYTKANKSEQIGLRASTLDLDKKIQDIFGKGFQLSQLQKLCKQHNGASVTVKSAAGTKINEDGTTEHKYKEETFELDNGQALYIYAIAKMPDGMIKLNAMGIDQEQIDAVEDTLTDELKEYQDWVQGEFLPKLRIKYNATHIQLFGTQLDQIENYFKLNISKGDLQQDVQIDDSAGYYGLPKTDTGSILKRVYNKNAIDIKNSNAIETLIEHLHKMEHWNAFAPLIKDLNTLNSNPAFTKHINRYIYNGAAEDFQRACKVAVGAYVPAGKGGLEEAIVATMRLYSAGKIAFRLNTALKQQLALIQVLGYGDLKLVGNSFKAAINPMSIKWCMDNIPDFFKRWNDRAGGDNTLMIRGDMDGTAFEKLHNRISDLASKGMIPNAAVDLWSCAIIAKGMYETKLVYYQSRKYNEAESKSKALTDAEISYNETMQSAEAGYLSYIQKDKTLWSSVFSLFNNASMSYQRLLIEGLRGIGKQMSRKQRADMIAFQKAKYLELGRTPEDASKFANSDVNMALRKNIMQVAMNGYIVQLVWNLGSAVGMMKAVQYLITFCGDDDDEKDRALEELKEDLKTSALKSFTTPVRGLPFGKEIESTVELYLRGWNWRQINVESNPLISDTKEFGVNMEEGFKNNDWVRILNGLVRYGVGFAGLDLNTVANITYGIHDLVENHEDITTTDVMYDLSLMINAPRSEQKFLGVSVRDDDTYEDILQRYISLKRVHKYGVFSPLTEVEDVRASQDVSKMVNVKYYTLRDMIREYERAADKYNERNQENRIDIYDNEALYNANSVMNSFSYEAKSSVLNKEQLNEIHTAIEALKNDKSLDETFTNMNIFLWRNSNKQQKESENINF